MEDKSSGDYHKSDDERVEVSDDALSHHHHHHEEAIVQERNRALSDDNHKESLLSPKTTATTSTKKLQSLSLDLGLTDLLHGKKFERGRADSDDSLYRRQIVEEHKSALSDDALKGYLLPKTSAATTKNTRKRQSSVDLFMDRFRRQKVERGCHGRCGFKLFGCDESCKHTNNNIIEQDKIAPPQMMNMPPSTSSVQSNHLGEEQKSALSDSVLKRYLPPKTSETATKNTKKHHASVDFSLTARVCRQKVERGCHDRCGFKLFGCDESCKHTNNNIVQQDKIAPPQMMNMPPASTSSAQNNNQERENTKTKTRHHIKLIIKQKKQVSTPHLPRVIVNDIISKGGSEIQHVGTKKLVDTDIERHQNRLNVINPDALMNALTPQERERVTGAQSSGLEVEMMDATGIKYSMNIRRRTCNGAAVINRQWSKLVHDKRLSRGDVVQLWGYRRSDGAFSLVLIDAINGERWFCDRCGIKLFGRYILLRDCSHLNDNLAVNEGGKGDQI